MRHNIVISFLVMNLMAVMGVTFYSHNLPFYNERLWLMAISLIIMGVIGHRFIFLYAISIILGFGGFLTAYSFRHIATGDYQTEYIYIHLLTTGFILLYWVLLHYLKLISNQYNELKDRIKELEKYNKDSKVLTPNEFINQARIICTTAFRRKEKLALLQVHINSKNKSTEKNLTETLGNIIFESIRGEYDIVTSQGLNIYVLLQNTQEIGVDIVKKRIRQKAKMIFREADDPFHFTEETIDTVESLMSKVGK